MTNEYAWICDCCGSKEVESREWVDMNSNKQVSEWFDLRETWCRNCEGFVEHISWTQPKEEKEAIPIVIVNKTPDFIEVTPAEEEEE